MRTSRNFIAGLSNSVWSAIVGLAVVPFYLKYLGVEAYGLIGLFVTLQAVLQLLDFGLAPTINREVARSTTAAEMQKARNLLHSLALIYWSTSALIAILLYLASPLIAEYWLQSNSLETETIVRAIMLMGLIIAARWPVGLYTGALMGAQRLTVSSGVNILIVTLSNFGAVFILAYVSPTIQAFFIWQATIGLLYAMTIRWAAWHIVKRPAETRFDLNGLKRVWRFSVGMSGVAVVSVFFLQADKFMLSRLLNLEEYGHYTLATVVASGLYVLLTPLYNTIYPHMTKLVTLGDMDGLARFYKMGTRMFLSLLFPLAASIAVFANELIFLWTGNHNLAIQVAPIASVLIIATAINGTMHFPYALQLAHGQTKIVLKISLILIFIMLPTLIVLANLYGAIGGAVAFLFLNLSYLIIGTLITHRHFLKGHGVEWLLRDVGVPLIITSLIIGLGGAFVKSHGYSITIEFFLGLALMLASIFFILLVSPSVRVQLNLYLHSFTSKVQI